MSTADAHSREGSNLNSNTTDGQTGDQISHKINGLGESWLLRKIMAQNKKMVIHALYNPTAPPTLVNGALCTKLKVEQGRAHILLCTRSRICLRSPATLVPS